VGGLLGNLSKSTGLKGLGDSQLRDSKVGLESKEKSSDPAEKKANKSKILMKSQVKVHEMMVNDKYSVAPQGLSSMVGKKIEEKRQQNQQREEENQTVKGNKEMDSFNVDILKNRFAADVSEGTRKQYKKPALKPIKSVQILRPNRSTIDDNPLIAAKSTVGVVRPRDKQLMSKRSHKLLPLNVNIFENTK
jgi:hypothetical protein